MAASSALTYSRLHYAIKRVSQWLSERIGGMRRVRVVAIVTVVCAILANLYCWTNSLFSHDSLLIVQHEVAHNASIGRPFQEVYVWFRGAIVAPLLVGSLGTLFIVISNIAIVSLLSIYSRGLVAASCSFLTVNATVTLINATYISWFDIMMFSCTLSCVAAWLICKTGKGFLPAALLICLSMGLYQSYFQVCVLLGLSFCIREIVDGDARQVLAVCAKGMTSLVLGVSLYVVVVLLARDLAGVESSMEYNSIFSAFSLGGTSILQALFQTWLDPFLYLAFPETHAVRLTGLIDLLLLALGAICLFRICGMKCTSLFQRVFLTVFLLLMPLAAGCINLAAFGGVHSMMIYSYFVFYPVIFSILELFNDEFGLSTSRSSPLDKKFWRGGVAAVAVLATAVALSNIVYANQVYLRKDLEYQATLSAITRLEARLEETDGYRPGETPVAFIGTFSDNPILNNVRDGFPPDEDQQPSSKSGEYSKYAVGLNSSVSLYGSSYIEKYFKYVLGCPLLLGNAPNTEMPIKAMVPECFPLEGSICEIDGTIVVRLS